MYIAYLDDSDTKSKKSKWQVMSSVVIKDSAFKVLEIGMGVLAEMFLPPEKHQAFTEFHACELYGGFGIFENIDQEKRFSMIKLLLSWLEKSRLPVVYGAVNLTDLNNMVYASADPLDIAFRICAEGVDKWLVELTRGRWQYRNEHPEEFNEEQERGLLSENMGILIADDCNSKSKTTIQRSFREMRKRSAITGEKSKLLCLHDDMYFGDSKFSLGIQLADVCSYFIARHLDGDAEIEGFYKLIEPHIVYSRIEPEEQNAKTNNLAVIGGGAV